MVYIISCTQCPSKYIGKTERTLDERVREHIGYVRNKQLHQPTGEHFNQPGHQVHHLRASVLEKVFTKDRKFVETRESLYIREFQTTRYGLNKKKWYFTVIQFCFKKYVLYVIMNKDHAHWCIWPFGGEADRNYLVDL